VGKKNTIKPPAPGVWDQIITKQEELEERLAAVEGAINALVVVYGVRRLPLPDQPGETT
jgi:hypothetical protein